VWVLGPAVSVSVLGGPAWEPVLELESGWAPALNIRVSWGVVCTRGW